MKSAAAFQATYSDWKLIRTRKCVQIVFEVPMETADIAYQALGGMPNPAAESWFAIARLVQPARKEVGTEVIDESPNTAQPASVKPPARAPRNKLAQLAGMLGKTPLFHVYIQKLWGIKPDEQGAAEYIRGYCHVKSRSEILPGTPAEEDFLRLYDLFQKWQKADEFVE